MTQLTHMGHRTYNYAGDWVAAISASGTRESAHRAFTRSPRRSTSSGSPGTLPTPRCAVRRPVSTASRSRRRRPSPRRIPDARAAITASDEYGGSFENRIRFPLEVIRRSAPRSATTSWSACGCRSTRCARTGPGSSPRGDPDRRRVHPRGHRLLQRRPRPVGHRRPAGEGDPAHGDPASPHLEFAGWVRKRVDVPVMHAWPIADVATARYAIAEGCWISWG